MPDYSEKISEQAFWPTAKRALCSTGEATLRPALELYYAMESPNTPIWVKAVAIAALGYFICPFDAIPDFIPGIGWLDDAATLTAAIKSLNRYITDDIRAKAKQKSKDIINNI
jgi:uncharacterized membrane protein YkvA (DUF1232 family)